MAELIRALGALGWGVLIFGGVVTIGFLGVFVWFAGKLFKSFRDF